MSSALSFVHDVGFYLSFFSFFFFNDTATTEIYTLSLHDALPIFNLFICRGSISSSIIHWTTVADRKSTRLNSSHITISYAVFCLKKKKKNSKRQKKKKKKQTSIITKQQNHKT